jgi:hypothetical protein
MSSSGSASESEVAYKLLGYKENFGLEEYLAIGFYPRFERRRCAVSHARQAHGMSETQCYRPTQRDDEDTLTQAIVTLASQYGRYACRRITALLQRVGWKVGKDRVERIWRREGLKVPQKQKPRELLCLNDGSCVRLRPQHANRVWSYDFVSAKTSHRHEGRAEAHLFGQWPGVRRQGSAEMAWLIPAQNALY